MFKFDEEMLIINIKYLVNVREESRLLRGSELANLPILENVWLLINNSKIMNYGLMSELKQEDTNDEVYDAKNATVLPSWCDSHTHLVFAETRENEFIDKINGLTYAEIAAKGGGILNSTQKLNETSEEILLERAQIRLNEVIQLGTGGIEIKSGYGLSLEGELKMLRVIQRLKQQNQIPIKATFLGAHAFPAMYKENKIGYINLIINEMIPNIASENLADYIDVFCENGFFTQEDTEQICEVGSKFGLKAKIHANQLNLSGGVKAGCNVNAVSVDHLETISSNEISLLSNSTSPIATLLPSCSFYLKMQYAPARDLINNNAAVALASDYNPGSSPSGNMNFVLSLACIQLKMLPEEVINASTINGAFAMELQDKVGSITKGKLANLIFTKPNTSIALLPYSFGSNLIDKVMVNGRFI
ncbi:MAG TPA: imidazolonepropionase [Chitinophagales bacterium]|nr:imidazolonepropionase [Chitinophagales bacterium]